MRTSCAGCAYGFGARSTTTNGSGFYSFASIPAGTYSSVTVSKPGYVSQTATPIVMTDGGTTTKDFALTLAPASGCLVDTTQADFQVGVPTSVDLTSAGTSAWEGASASDGALLVGMEHGLDLSMHRAQLLSRELVAASDVVLAMGPHHLERVEALGGINAFTLVNYASHGRSDRAISDPVGAELTVYRATYDELEHEIRRSLDRLTADRPARGQ